MDVIEMVKKIEGECKPVSDINPARNCEVCKLNKHYTVCPMRGYISGRKGLSNETVRDMYKILFIDIEMKKEFSKSDLRTGMIVELRRGDLMFVVKNEIGISFLNREGCLNGDSYYDSLLNKTLSSFDVIKIYNPESIDKLSNINELCEKCGNLIWKRPKKMTRKEIEKILGYEIEIDEGGKMR